MLLTISGRHIEVSEAFRQHAEQKVSKLPRFYNNIGKIEVIVEGGQGSPPGVEIIASSENNRVFVVNQVGEDIYMCIDKAVHKLERQLRKHKQIERDNKR